MSKLELFLHDQPEPTPVLLKAALAHVQFETIHPFLDGNGRMGRLLITLLLCDQKVLREPMLYLSLYFKTHRRYYYELLNTVRLTGDWEAWLDFFAEAVIVTATQAVETAQQLLDLSNQDRDKIGGLGRAAASTLQIHRALMEHPIATSGSLVVIKRTAASRSMGAYRSFFRPSSSMATQLRANPSEMLWATSNPVGEWSNCFKLPSGSVIVTIFKNASFDVKGCPFK
jgi:Fic family protein